MQQAVLTAALAAPIIKKPARAVTIAVAVVVVVEEDEDDIAENEVGEEVVVEEGRPDGNGVRKTNATSPQGTILCCVATITTSFISLFLLVFLNCDK